MTMDVQSELTPETPDSGKFADNQSETSEKQLSLEELRLILRDKYKTAEKAIKDIENSVKISLVDLCSSKRLKNQKEDQEEVQGLFLPAINELRYAGFHMSKVLTSEKVLENLYEAIFHCERAKNDAYDCLIQYYLGEIRLFMERYRSIVKSDLIADYTLYKEQVIEVQQRSKRSDSENQSSEEIENQVEWRVQDYKILEEIYNKLESYSEELNVRLKKERKTQLYSLWGIISGLLALVIAILTLIVTLFK